MFEEIEEESFALREARVLRFWKEQKIFEQSLAHRKKAPLFSTYDGPPFATGLPHYGHLLAGTIKDVVPRYKTMKGYYVPRRFGWDTHGLPVEQEIEKAWQLSGATAIESFGIARFNEECRKIVLRYVEQWKETVERMGRWVDFSQTYKTMDRSFMESVWWIFKQLYDQGLVYEGLKVMPFSAKLGTPLSNFEASENYKDVQDPSIVVAFPLEDSEASLLVWTTTPWTLPSNMAVALHPDLVYVHVRNEAGSWILAEEALSRWFSVPPEIIQRFQGSEWIGRAYRPPFSYFATLKSQGAFTIIPGSFVTTGEGTGCVHIAPAFGEEDFYAAQAAQIPLVCPVDRNGLFTEEIPDLAGRFVKDCDGDLIRQLQRQGLLFHRSTLVHRYPFCWRSDTPLIYRSMTTWFVRVEAIKSRMLALADHIHWTPDHLKEGRFGHWLEGARDWAISRNRYWGTPIPIWRSSDGEIHVIESVAELEQLTGHVLEDLHRHFVDGLTFVKNGKTFTRIPEVFDCWFESGSMPFAQNHYPFENQEETDRSFPADFIAEGVDQTRCWFYVLTILSTALRNQIAFRNVIANGIVLAEDGKKMSKRLKNYPEPSSLLDQYGADAVRLYMLHSPAVRAEDLRFSSQGVELVLRQVLIPLWNAQAFFTTYARIYDWNPSHEVPPSQEIDRWIVSKIQELTYRIELGMADYDLSRAVDPLVAFVDQLTNWYIRRNRRRFWNDQPSKDRNEAFSTLYRVLLDFCKLLAPFTPFLTEAIYLRLREAHSPISVHLCDYPSYNPLQRDVAIEKAMDAVQCVVSLGHSLRKEQKIKVRQPLPAVHLICVHLEDRQALEQHQDLIAEELNVKAVVFHAQSHQFVSRSVKPNFRVLGKKVGKWMKEVHQQLSSLSDASLMLLLEGKSIEIPIEAGVIQIDPADVEITQTALPGCVATSIAHMTVALETNIDHALCLEGIAREIVNKINTMRRDQNLAVTDRIALWIAATPLVLKALHAHQDYVAGEILAIQVHIATHPQATHWDLNGEPAALAIEKIEHKRKNI